MSLTDKQLGTAVKVLSIRRENLYSSLRMQTRGSDRWSFFSEQIDDLTDAINGLEHERERLRHEPINA